MQDNGRQPAARRTWGDHRARPAGSVDLRLSLRSLVVAPTLYLVGMIVLGTLGANFLLSWVFGVLLCALVVAVWVSRDALQRRIPGAYRWGLTAGFVPLAGVTLYLMRREARQRELT